MAKKSPAGGIFIVGIVLFVLGLVARYAKELLVVAGVVFAAWLAYRLLFRSKPAATVPAPALTPSPQVPPTRTPSAPAAKRTFFEMQSRESPGRVTSRNGDDFWVRHDASVAFRGQPIQGGIYVGSGLGAINVAGLEPALLDPALPVSKVVNDCTLRRLNYWPSYATASPEARAAYLKWLRGGRSELGADLGYVFLYFYGLERRALHDAHVSEAAKAELPWIIAELERLLAIYGHSGSFRLYAGSLLDLLRYQTIELKSYLNEPKPVVRGQGLTLEHRIALGQCAADQVPLPASWAYVWLVADPSTYLKTAAVRCPNEFKSLFTKRYADVFGSGMALPKSRTQLKLERRAASPTFDQGGDPHVLQFHLPDVSVLAAPMTKLQELAEWCYPQLDRYSRYLAKDTSLRDSFDAIVELPVALWPERYRRVVESASRVTRQGQRPVAVPFEKFLSWFPDWDAMTKPKAKALARAFAEAGLGMEPDVRFGGPPPNGDTPVVLFADDVASQTERPSPRYVAAALTLQLAAAVALADGTPTDGEKALMARQLEEWLHLSQSERRRLQAFSRLVLAQPPKLSGLKAKVGELDATQRDAIGDFLALVAQADETITPAEIKTLEKCYRLLGLDTQQLYSKLHVAATDPVTVRKAEPTDGHRIPQPVTSARSPIALDPARIAELQRDTERVSSILSSIFADTETEPDEPVQPLEELPPEAKSTILDLPAAESAVVQILLSRPQWTRAELQELAEDRELMLDGVLERINEACFDKYEQPLLEGDEVMEVNPEIVRELLQ